MLELPLTYDAAANAMMVTRAPDLLDTPTCLRATDTSLVEVAGLLRVHKMGAKVEMPGMLMKLAVLMTPSRTLMWPPTPSRSLLKKRTWTTSWRKNLPCMIGLPPQVGILVFTTEVAMCVPR